MNTVNKQKRERDEKGRFTRSISRESIIEDATKSPSCLLGDLQPRSKEYTTPDILLKALSGEDATPEAQALKSDTTSQIALVHLASINPDMARLILENLHKVFPQPVQPKEG